MHTLAVESFHWRGGNGQCDKSACAAVQNEVHILSYCKSCLCALSKVFIDFLPFWLTVNPYL